MFKVGDNIVYPMHGAGTIESIEEKSILGESKKYYVMKMPGDVKVMVPTNNAENIGVRDVIPDLESKKVFEVLENQATDMTLNWNKRYRDNMDKMKSGDIYAVADVVRTLSFKQKEKGLSTGEKKMLVNAKQILVSELALSSQAPEDSIENQINQKIDLSFDEYMDDNKNPSSTGVSEEV